ncbi:Cell cycle checkpoint kinase 2 [Operophtera brumata]|uniref:Cell cycle checkpoint kinase 2 n=1 Tax=Operophtera brumata TaxID=104452 RepID=A0A0L7LTR0_OPEBR|nr:Cell cycle checkpoint kinase 2 [Operophtera brumata]
MGDDTQKTQTQNSQVEWSQHNTPPTNIPNIWGRLYSTKVSMNGRHCWKNSNNPEYIDLVQPEFSLGRALACTFVMKKYMESLSPAILTDMSYNGTFINGQKIGKGNSRVLDDNDEISVTHPVVKLFIFKDLLKNEQDRVPKEISQKYYISRVLGQGACGLVKLVYNKPCIISTEEVFDSRDAVYIILELMQGGELFDRITKNGHLSEPLTRFIFRQMVLAVKYLHSQGITHRDLKPENVLLESMEEETLVKLTDFGLSKFVGEDSFMKTICGTPLYLAPEVLRSNGVQCYGPEVDVWSLGVIFFVLRSNGVQCYEPEVDVWSLGVIFLVLRSNGVQCYGPEVDVWSLGVIFFVLRSNGVQCYGPEVDVWSFGVIFFVW